MTVWLADATLCGQALRTLNVGNGQTDRNAPGGNRAADGRA